MKTFAELVEKALEHAQESEAIVAEESRRVTRAAERGGEANVQATVRALAQLRELAGVHATLAEAYARLASASIVNATSLHAAAEAQAKAGGRPS